MNNSKSLQLDNFSNLYVGYHKKFDTDGSCSFSIAGLLGIVCDYYSYALEAHKGYKIALDEFCDECFNDKNLEARNIIKNRMTMLAFGIYINGNVCLQITNKLNDYIENFSQEKTLLAKLAKLRTDKDTVKWVKDFTEKRNLIVAHPAQNNNSTGSCNCFPDRRVELRGWGSGGFAFEIFSLLTGHTYKEFKVNPYQEIKQLRNWLESLAPIYAEFLGVTLNVNSIE